MEVMWLWCKKHVDLVANYEPSLDNPAPYCSLTFIGTSANVKKPRGPKQLPVVPSRVGSIA